MLTMQLNIQFWSISEWFWLICLQSLLIETFGLSVSQDEVRQMNEYSPWIYASDLIRWRIKNWWNIQSVKGVHPENSISGRQEDIRYEIVKSSPTGTGIPGTTCQGQREDFKQKMITFYTKITKKSPQSICIVVYTIEEETKKKTFTIIIFILIHLMIYTNNKLPDFILSWKPFLFKNRDFSWFPSASMILHLVL